MKKIDKVLLDSKKHDLELVVREATFLEDLGNKGKTSEGVLSDAKKRLSLGSDDSIIAEYGAKLAEINKLHKAFIDVNSLTSKLTDAKLIEEDELEVLAQIESRIGDKLMDIFDLELEDLYS